MFSLLKQVWQVIRSLLLFIGKVNSIILLTIFYLVILGPVAVLVQVFKGVKTEKSRRSYWQRRNLESETEVTLLRQF
ncbi:MAG: hypothetical protein HYS86_04925 [Candidatus Chisholmbacteria bacterium]|nr:hypothetical protein [Candidatus Chisholmbacteria bacterium]